MYSGSYIAQQLINGLNLGSVYALVAIGLTMVYGLLRLINFAHGDLMMLGAYMALFVVANTFLPLGFAVLVPMLVIGLAGHVDRAYRLPAPPRRARSRHVDHLAGRELDHRKRDDPDRLSPAAFLPVARRFQPDLYHR